MTALALHRVTKAHGGTPAIDELSLKVADGELLTVVGPSGAGKSTLLRLIAGLEAPDGGHISVGDRDVTAVPAAKRGLAMVFQSFALFPHLTVEGNVAFGLVARGVCAAERTQRVREVATRLDIEGLLERRPSQLSGGERQRVALARGLVGRPGALLLDEPLSNLDAQLRLEMRAELRRLHSEAALTMVHVTHDQAEALSLGDRVAVLRKGRLEQCGPPEEVYGRPASAWIARFLGSPPMNVVPGIVAGTVVRACGLEFPLPPEARVQPNTEVLVGVRPEHLRLVGLKESRAVGQVTVELDETTGHERLLRLRAGEQELIARVAPGTTPARGETVAIAVALPDVHLFHATTGRAMRRGPR